MWSGPGPVLFFGLDSSTPTNYLDSAVFCFIGCMLLLTAEIDEYPFRYPVDLCLVCLRPKFRGPYWAHIGDKTDE